MSRSRKPLAMRPQGLAGQVFGFLMEAINSPAYRFALDLLSLKQADDVLEIGFGTGRMIELMLAATHGRIVGLDPTPTMVAWARSRKAIRREAGRVSLWLGSDVDLVDIPGAYDRIVALHSFQFWSDPTRTVQRLRGLFRPKGSLVLVLRDHSGGGADWLPNPLSRGSGEPEAVSALLGEAGFDPRIERRGRMVGVVGVVR